MLNIAIVDDEKHYSDELNTFIKAYASETDLEVNVDTFDNGLDLIFDFKPFYDVYLLDIKMPHMDGMELAKLIRQSDQKAVILFITNTPHFAIQGYEVNAFDYIVKPMQYGTFKLIFKSALKMIKRSNDRLSILVDGESLLINTEDIIFIEVSDHLLTIETLQSSFQIFASLKEIEAKLSASTFVRCNKSTLINLRHIERIQLDKIFMTDDHNFVASRSKKKLVQKAFIDYYSQMV